MSGTFDISPLCSTCGFCWQRFRASLRAGMLRRSIGHSWSDSMAALESLLIWGAGQHGRVVAEVARLIGHTVVGFVDVDPDKFDRVIDRAGARVILTQAQL